MVDKAVSVDSVAENSISLLLGVIRVLDKDEGLHGEAEANWQSARS